MAALWVKREGDILTIGESPQLVVNLKTQDNYVQDGKGKIPYKRKVLLSEDLLQGKRKNVLETAARYYYHHACGVADGIRLAEKYRAKANLTTREVKESKN